MSDLDPPRASPDMEVIRAIMLAASQYLLREQSTHRVECFGSTARFTRGRGERERALSLRTGCGLMSTVFVGLVGDDCGRTRLLADVGRACERRLHVDADCACDVVVDVDCVLAGGVLTVPVVLLGVGGR